MVQRRFDRIHEMNEAWNLVMLPATVTSATTLPLIMNDDALGDPMSYNTNPEHASFTEEEMPNCYPDSEIKRFKLSIDIQILKKFWDIDKGMTFTFEYALIACAFPEDLDAIDEKSGLSLKEILELQKESTDRQCYPLFNAVNMNIPSILHANVPGLTATQAIEAVAWDAGVIHDQRRYGKLKGLIKKSLPIGIRRVNMNMEKSKHKRITIRFNPSNTKFINPYTFLGIMINVPKATDNTLRKLHIHSPLTATDITANAYASCSIQCTFNERNPDFHMAKV